MKTIIFLIFFCFIPTLTVQLGPTYITLQFYCKIVGFHIKRDDYLYIASFTRLLKSVLFSGTVVDT